MKHTSNCDLSSWRVDVYADSISMPGVNIAHRGRVWGMVLFAMIAHLNRHLVWLCGVFITDRWLQATRWEEVPSPEVVVYTFGQPRVGNVAFSEDYGKPFADDKVTGFS